MSVLRKCDICGENFNFGFSVGVSFQGDMSFADIAKHRFELGKKDICENCYYKIKNKIVSDNKTEQYL